MNQHEWEQLCLNIYERKCILFIGAEFPLEIDDPDSGEKSETTFAKLLSNKISDEIKDYKQKSLEEFGIADSAAVVEKWFDENISGRELSQLANDYISIAGKKDVNSRIHLNS